MGHEHTDIGPQRDIREVVEVGCGIAPVHRVDTFLQYGLGNVLHPGKAIDDRVLLAFKLLAKTGTEAAVAHQYSGGTVADDFRQARLQVHFQVQVGVDIQQPRHQPLALGLDDAHGLGRRQCLPASGHPALPERDILLAGRPAATVENQCVANQGIPGGGCHWCNPLRYPAGSVTSTGSENPVVYPAAGAGEIFCGPARAVTRKHRQICLCWQ